MSLGALMAGHGTLIVGVEDQADGSTRVYVAHRSRGIYFDEPAEAVEAARTAWNSTSGHVIADVNELPPLKTDSDRAPAVATQKASPQDGS